MHMKPYLTYSAEDFACDEDFLKWVKYPELYPRLDLFWKKWISEHPVKKDVVEEARQLVLGVIAEKQYLPASGKQREIWDRIQTSTRVHRRQQIPVWQRWYNMAAVILFMVSISWLFLDFNPAEQIVTVQEDANPQYVRHANNADIPKTIILSDGTSIMLQPQSVLEYPETFEPDRREVFLTGQAFFEVTRDPNRPFLVQAGEIVTRVLGTSFTVRNFEGEDNVLVQVKTGKVSVFMATEKPRPLGLSQQIVDGVVLMPNQQVLYERMDMKMTKSLVENPAVIIPLARQEFEFVDAPVKDVFTAIEQAYGVDIVFDEDALSTCYLNASLADVPLYDKLKLICKAINTTYEIIDSHIIVYGKGCNEEIINPNEN